MLNRVSVSLELQAQPASKRVFLRGKLNAEWYWVRRDDGATFKASPRKKLQHVDANVSGCIKIYY